ncbi:MAG: cation-translocating P-type ATPase [Synergistes sp.]|nr:cation-translocating P-type ATPase [Synergistes sp.]
MVDGEQSVKWNFRIFGMTCTTCSRLAERALKKTTGVEFASVNLTTESAFVIASPDVTWDILQSAVKNAGYEAAITVTEDLEEAKNAEAKRTLIEVLAVGVPLSCLMYLKMLFGVNVPFYSELEIAIGAVALFRCGRKTFRGAWIAAAHCHTNMDTLIAISACASWLTAILSYVGFAIPSFGTVGVMIMMLHLTGRYIEARLRGRAAKRIKALLTLQPHEARVITESSEILVPIEAVKPDTIIAVKPGERIPIDGVVTEGRSGVDESLLTGESMPVLKCEESEVIGGSLNINAPLKIRAAKTGEDTFLSGMLNLVREAQGAKVPLQALADRITIVFVPTIIALAAASAAAWLLFFPSLSRLTYPLLSLMPWDNAAQTPISAAIYSFIATLVIACPCALGLATPLALVACTGESSRCGLLIRNAEAVQTLKDADLAVLDKTGTITEGKPSVIKWEATDEALDAAYTLESSSGHPLAAAILSVTGKRKHLHFEETEETAGEGVCGTLDKDKWFIGRADNTFSYTDLDIFAATVVQIRKNGKHAGYFAITDPIRDDTASAVCELNDLGITAIMATGDSQNSAKAAAFAAGIKNFRSGVRPEDKLTIVQDEQRKGHRVIMAGDGINDAAALKAADVGIAMGTGMDLAVDSADIVIMNGGISRIASAVRISRITSRIIKQNLVCAFVYNIIAVPLAMAGVLHPIAAECAMAASSLTVILNSLRIIGSAEKRGG